MDDQIKSLTEDLMYEATKVDDRLLILFLKSLKSDQEQGLEEVDHVMEDASSGSCTGQDAAGHRYVPKKTSETEEAEEAEEDESESSSTQEHLFITQWTDRTRHEKE